MEFALDTDLSQGLHKLIVELEHRLRLRTPIQMYIAGGMAFHLYTGSRVTTDVDAEFSKRVLLPSNLTAQTAQGRMLYLDTNYNSSFALLHEDYIADAVKVPIGTDFIEVFVLHPVDLVLSKIARLSGPDAADIAELIERFDITPEVIEARAEIALQGYVGNEDYLRMNLREVLRQARDISNRKSPAGPS